MNRKNEANLQLKEFQGDLSGKLALVTGASRGIGRAIAICLARQGASVVIHGRDSEKLEAVSAEIRACGVECFVQALDVRNEKLVDSALKEIETQLGAPHILVNNAGIYRTAPVLGHSTEDWNAIIDTNLNSAFYYCRAVISGMLAHKWGRIINISSISGKVAEMHGAAYSASKFALIGLTQALALELATNGITANAVCPGWVETEMSAKQLNDPSWGGLDSCGDAWETARSSVPQLRFIETEEVARLVAYLASDAARGITGQSINICGGMCLS